MLKVLRIFIMSILFVAIMTGSAHAGVLDKVKSWITGDVMAFFLSGIVVILGGMFGTALKKMNRTFKEVGEFLTVLGTALEDQKLTREELAAIVREGKDIFVVWK